MSDISAKIAKELDGYNFITADSESPEVMTLTFQKELVTKSVTITIADNTLDFSFN